MSSAVAARFEELLRIRYYYYYCIDNSILISKLFQYGIKEISLKWFESYFSERKYVSLKLVDSTVLSLYHGVPQGSIFAPLLFLIYIEDF